MNVLDNIRVLDFSVHEQGPASCGFNLLEYVSGVLLAQGVLLALMARAKTGHGQIVDADFLSAGVAVAGTAGTAHLNPHGAPATPGPRRGNPAYALYETADGRWLHVIDTFTDRALERLCRAVGVDPALAAEPDAAAGQLRDALRTLPLAEAIRRIEGEGVMAVPVNGQEEAFRDPQVRHNGMIWDASHPVAGSLKLVGCPIRLSDTPASLRLPPPLLGENGRQILGELLGMSDEQIDALEREGVVAEPNSVAGAMPKRT